MIFEEKCNEKMLVGEKHYGKDTWKSLSPTQLLTEAQDELIDCFNYLKMVGENDGKMSTNYKLASITTQLKTIYYELEKLKC